MKWSCLSALCSANSAKLAPSCAPALQLPYNSPLNSPIFSRPPILVGSVLDPVSRCCLTSAVQGGAAFTTQWCLLSQMPTAALYLTSPLPGPSDPFLQNCSLASPATACSSAWGFSVPKAGLWSSSCQPILLFSQDPCISSLCLLPCVNLHSDALYKSFVKIFHGFGPGLDAQGMTLVADCQLDF